MKINNPVLKGFNPDPTMCRAENKYYIATSTFQWYPGITIYETEDLANYQIVATPLTNDLGFDLRGIDDSAGIWAPNIIYHNHIFYLSYTIVKSATGVYYDMENYIVTASDIRGEWSKPIQVNSGMFDPSLFFDNDKLYMFGKIVDHRYEPTNDYIDKYSGIIIQELCPKTLGQIGDYEVITYGTNIGGEEGPQMFKRNGYYYLNIAEGGTEYNHQTTVLRSKNLKGPYEVHPANPVLKSTEDDYLQKAGHSSFVNTGDDNWIISHLCARPIKSTAKEIEGKLCCPLGRETAIQNIRWEDDWPYLTYGNNPKSTFEIPTDVAIESQSNFMYNFEKMPNEQFLSLRTDVRNLGSVSNNKMTMVGKDSLMSKFDVNLYGYRPDTLKFETAITIDFKPQNYLQMGGLTLYYDTENYLTVFISNDKTYGKCIKVEAVRHRKYSTLEVRPVSIDDREVKLSFVVDNDRIKTSYQVVNEQKQFLDCEYHTSYLSDDYILLNKPSFFTGMMIGFYTSDLTGSNLESTVSNFEYIKS